MKRMVRYIAIARPNATSSRVASLLPAAPDSSAEDPLRGGAVLPGMP
ncbi:UNVERIFIED_ORG: hypothetical protein J3D58_001258 [Paenarthrobacter nicotinovorans]